MLVLGDEAEPLVVGVEEHELAALGVDGDLVRHAGVVEQRAIHVERGLASRSAARAAPRAAVRCSRARRRVGEARVVGELGRAERAAQRRATAARVTAAIWIQPSLVS